MPDHFAVVGAGAFGGWTALHLLRAGARVTLIDAWGPGHSRSSSGDETRVIRGSYGPNAIYTRMVARSLPQWRDNQRRWGVPLLLETGALWMAADDDSYEQASVAALREASLPFEILQPADCRARFPQVNWEGVPWAIHEKEAGFLLARRACQAVTEGFVAENGAWRLAGARPGAIRSGRMEALALSDGTSLTADQYVFACGPWLGELFPGVLGGSVTPTRQEVFYFGTPAGDARFNGEQFPAWVDNNRKRFYGIPGNQWRGFKAAEDATGEPFDPTRGERTHSPAWLAKVRAYLGFRFPALADAPLTESRVCQYEMSPDGDLILGRHPEASNVWLAGGGSGHGFKFGPAFGEDAARCVRGEASPEPRFALSRLGAAGGGRVGERK